MADAATALARWSAGFDATAADLALAERALTDTAAVAIAARSDPLLPRVAAHLGEAGRWAVAAHLLDYDDLHMASTTHVSAVCVPVTLAVGGGAAAYLAGAGVLSRVGTAPGWTHYAAGWHATTTAGALGAAATAAHALGLDQQRTAVALALAVPAAGGVQRAFGTDAKAVQVGFAADAGVRAAQLAASGVSADRSAVDSWLCLLGADLSALVDSLGEEEAGAGDRSDAAAGAPAIPGGLAVKLHPCCYAAQRPIEATRRALAGRSAETAADPGSARHLEVRRVVVRTPAGTLTPLLHHRPVTGLEGKFSLEYAVAATLLDSHPGLGSFTDDAVMRPLAQQLLRSVEVDRIDGGDDLLSGTTAIEVYRADGTVDRADVALPPGAPGRPMADVDLDRKVTDCLAGSGVDIAELSWDEAGDILRLVLPGPSVRRWP